MSSSGPKYASPVPPPPTVETRKFMLKMPTAPPSLVTQGDQTSLRTLVPTKRDALVSPGLERVVWDVNCFFFFFFVVTGDLRQWWGNSSVMKKGDY